MIDMFVAITTSGIPRQTIMGATSDQYQEGQEIADGLILKKMPAGIDTFAVLRDYFYSFKTNEWKYRGFRASDCYSWDAENEVWITDLTIAKNTLSKSVNEVRDAHLYGDGVTYLGYNFDSKESTYANISQTLAFINAGIPIQEGYVWRTADNINVPFNETNVMEFAQVLFEHKNYCYQNSWRIKEEIAAITTVLEVESYNIESRW